MDRHPEAFLWRGVSRNNHADPAQGGTMKRLPDSLKSEIAAEIEQAVAKHGEQESLPDSVWCCIATEEMGEIAEGVLKEGFGKKGRSVRDAQARWEHTDNEIVQLTSVLIHWLSIRRAAGRGKM